MQVTNISLALGISKIALNHLSFLNWYDILKKGDKIELLKKICPI